MIINIIIIIMDINNNYK